MTTTLYRKSINEVLKNSVKDQTFSDRDNAVFGVLTDPSFPDGTNTVDPADEPPVLRKLGFAKHADVGGDIVRNATQAEIDTWPAAELDDDNQQDADRAAELGDTHKQFRKIFKAMLKNIVREGNIKATKYNELRAEMLAASNFNDLKTRVQDNTSDAPIRTNQQAFDILRTDVDKDD